MTFAVFACSSGAAGKVIIQQAKAAMLPGPSVTCSLVVFRNVSENVTPPHYKLQITAELSCSCK